VQTPDAGPFNVLDLDWMFVAESNSHFKVAAFAKGRLSDYLDGEAEKGCTFKISGRKADKRTPWVITDLTALCKYLLFTTLEHQEMANLPLTNVQGHHRKIIMGQRVLPKMAAATTSPVRSVQICQMSSSSNTHARCMQSTINNAGQCKTLMLRSYNTWPLLSCRMTVTAGMRCFVVCNGQGSLAVAPIGTFMVHHGMGCAQPCP
jgi:hypothetical protein